MPSRDAVRKYLGFRHLGGIKTWSAEAKARYIAREVDAAANEESPFIAVSRRVGSNVQGVRNAYIAISTLRYARDEFSLDTKAVLYNRFGVWTRCMNSPELRAYIGLGDPRTLPAVRRDVATLDKAHLAEVLGDLTPAPGKKKPLLADSRDVTVYAQALHDEQAHRALRDRGDLELARQLVEEATLPDRLAALTNSVETMI